jgi:hypothetical protein
MIAVLAVAATLYVSGATSLVRQAKTPPFPTEILAELSPARRVRSEYLRPFQFLPHVRERNCEK